MNPSYKGKDSVTLSKDEYLQIQILSEHAREGIALTVKGIIKFANNKLAEMMGYDSKEELKGLSVMDFVPENEKQKVAEMRKKGLKVPYDTYMKTKEGSILPISTWGIPTKWKGQDARITSLMDITHRKEEETKNEALQQQIIRSQKLESLGILAGGVAHDFNNLLVGILGNVSMALMDLPKESDVAEYLKEIEKTSLKAAELTKQMLAYTGKAEVKTELVNLKELILESEHLLRMSISKIIF